MNEWNWLVIFGIFFFFLDVCARLQGLMLVVAVAWQRQGPSSHYNLSVSVTNYRWTGSLVDMETPKCHG